MENVRKKCISFKEQSPTLINGSVEKNIMIGLNKTNCNKLIGNYKVDDFVNCFAEGVNRYIDLPSNNFSGGEKEKIGFVRTVLKQADLLIFGEPSTGVDDLTVEKIINSLEAIKNDKIILIITHDPRFIKMADTVIKM